LGPETVYGNESGKNKQLFLRQQFFGIWNSTVAAVRKLHVVQYDTNNEMSLSYV
jgi:hypothetical protein